MMGMLVAYVHAKLKRRLVARARRRGRVLFHTYENELRALGLAEMMIMEYDARRLARPPQLVDAESAEMLARQAEEILRLADVEDRNGRTLSMGARCFGVRLRDLAYTVKALHAAVSEPLQ